jgi:hypothetical protein
MLHGTLMEAPCEESKIYGSPWYLEQVAKYGPPYDRVWLEAAAAAQLEAEAHCGNLPSWKVQRTQTSDIQEMPPKKKEIKSIKNHTILKTFTPIRVMYQESDAYPEKLSTDSCKLTRTVQDGVSVDPVFTSAVGHVFSIGTDGEPGELLGRMVDGSFVKL